MPCSISANCESVQKSRRNLVRLVGASTWNFVEPNTEALTYSTPSGSSSGFSFISRGTRRSTTLSRCSDCKKALSSSVFGLSLQARNIFPLLMTLPSGSSRPPRSLKLLKVIPCGVSIQGDYTNSSPNAQPHISARYEEKRPAAIPRTSAQVLRAPLREWAE